MPDYSKTIIYVIKCKDEDVEDLYVGHTTNFSRRKREHKSRCNNIKKYYNFKIYHFIQANGGWNNFDMTILEEYPCENKRQAELKEEEIRVEREAQLNMIRAFRTEEQHKEQIKTWNENNEKEKTEEEKEKEKEEKKEYDKEYFQKNKERKRKQNLEWREKHKEELKEYFKQYNQKNNQKRKEQQRQLREKNKEKINERQRQKRAEKKLLNNIHNEPSESD